MFEPEPSPYRRARRELQHHLDRVEHVQARHLVRAWLVGSRANVMRCAECECVSEDAAGWIALLGRDPDDRDAPAEMIAFCSVCASREFRMAAKFAETYT